MFSNPSDFVLFTRFWSKVHVRRADDCWEWCGGMSNEGYGRFKVGGKLVSAHRFAYEQFYGPIPADSPNYHGNVVLHKCDNPKCCNPKHLSLGDQKLNVSDMIAKGRRVKRQMTERIKQLVPLILSDPRSNREVGRKLGISHNTVRRIRTGNR